jgi:hypothetical protein
MLRIFDKASASRLNGLDSFHINMIKISINWSFQEWLQYMKNNKSSLSRFEIIQTVFGLIQTAILVLTLSYAIKIGNQQNEINKSILDLNFSPSFEVKFSASKKNFGIHNKGSRNLFLCGTRFEKREKILSNDQCIIIAVGGSYFIPADTVLTELLQTLRPNEEKTLELEIFFKTEQNQKFTSSTSLLAIRSKENLEIRTQLIGLEKIESF